MPTSDDVPRNPGLEDLLRVFGQALLDDVRTALPAICTDYDASTGRGSFQVAIQHGRLDEVGDRIAETISECHNVPVMFLGGGSNRITVPVKTGDQATLKFCSSAIGQWKALGRVSDPLDDRHHDLSDAIAFMGVTGGAQPTPTPDDAIVIHASGGITIKLGGAGADDGVARKSDLDALVTGLDARIAVLSAGLPATATELATVQAIKDALPPGWPTCSTKVFV